MSVRVVWFDVICFSLQLSAVLPGTDGFFVHFLPSSLSGRACAIFMREEGTRRGFFQSVSRSFVSSSSMPLSLSCFPWACQTSISERSLNRQTHAEEYPSQYQVKHSMTREQNENRLRTARVELAVITAGIITHIRRATIIYTHGKRNTYYNL